ncbi:RHS repeat-associated core domain-containing protein [Flavobacterium sp. F-65]|uniref:RHS repeat-associated core domain-containing protein n=1 Tax=Flavobacterium pisciphilum TaxID=2893755 RepID=A0ABS8MN37_9FLAO|nr:RHS repeat-associated core domain-containing protein [Flavobacterium sp. F-65]
MLEENNYYSFGLKYEGYNTDNKQPNYKYKYNGKELQDESIGGIQLNLYDFGARNYDPALGRWMNMDAMSEKYTDLSPYNYTINNPVNVIDPDGNDIILLIWLSQNGDVGHAALAISNYKKDKDGNYVTDKKGNNIEDGTYTYYDFEPAEGIGEKNYDKSVRGKVNKRGNMTMKDIENSNPAFTDKPQEIDGILRVKTSSSYDEKIKDKLENNVKNSMYNLIKNNCTDFVAKAFRDGVGKEEVTDVNGNKVNIVTQYRLFKDLKESTGTKVIRNPGSEVKKNCPTKV